jgi:VWFA-related protein
MKTIFAIISLCLLPFSTALFAQAPEAEIIKKGDKNLISVPVTVSDREGRYISGLKKEDFSIYQDGVKQNIEFFATYDEPLNIALLLDTSGSTEGEALLKIKDAAKEFIDLLNPADQCFVATFDSQVNILSHFTSDHGDLKKTIDKVQTAHKDGTVLYQAITAITQKSFITVQGRKVIILLSDGKDFGSFINRKDLLSLLEESDVMIYSIFYQTSVGVNKLVVDSKGNITESPDKKKEKQPKPPKKPKGYVIGIPPQIDIIPQEEIKYSEKTLDISAIDFLRELSDLTAGRFYQSDTPDLGRIFKKVAGELRQQYRLGYYSKESTRNLTLPEIVVKVGRGDAVVRTRTKFRGK